MFRVLCIVAAIKHTVAYITSCTVHFAASARPRAVRPPRGLPLQMLIYRTTWCIGPPPLHPCECIFHRHYVCPLVPTQNERDGLAGRWRRGTLPPVSRSQSRTSVNDARPWKLYTPPGIHVRRQCGDVMYVCHSIRGTDRNRVGAAV